MATSRTPRTREQFINNISVGNIVAFKHAEHIYSAKVISINADTTITAMTKNNSIFYIDRSDVVWVKLGTHWPVGIYNALKYKNLASDKTEPST